MPSNCQIVGLLGILIQLSLGLLSFSVLVIKRFRQIPKRQWRVWILDTSKQITSQLIAHFINLSISLALSYQQTNSDVCLWYLMTNILDNTFGMAMCIGCLKLVEHLLRRKNKKQYISGNYYIRITKQEQIPIEIIIQKNAGEENPQQNFKIQLLQLQSVNRQHKTTDSKVSDQKNVKQQKDSQLGNQKNEIAQTKRQTQLTTVININYKFWVIQLLIWISIVVVGKSIIFGFEFALKSQLQSLSQAIFGWLQSSPTLQLVVCIVIVPVFMNALCFWVQDNFLKKKEKLEEETSLLGQIGHQEQQTKQLQQL